MVFILLNLLLTEYVKGTTSVLDFPITSKLIEKLTQIFFDLSLPKNAIFECTNIKSPFLTPIFFSLFLISSGV